MDNHQFTQINQSINRLIEQQEKTVKALNRLADTMGKLKDIFGEKFIEAIEDIPGAILTRPIVHQEGDMISHPLELLGILEDQNAGTVTIDAPYDKPSDEDFTPSGPFSEDK